MFDIILLITSFIAATIKEGETIGCTSQLISEQTSRQNVHVVYDLYSDSNRYGFYNYDGCKQNATVAPIEGVYFLSTSLILESYQDNDKTWLVKVYFREKLNPQKRYCVGSEIVNVKSQTVATACFSRLDLRTDLEIVLEDGIGLVIVPWLSTFSIQHIGASGILPTLIHPLEEITTKLNQSRSKSNSGFVNSLTVLHGDGKIPIKCSGLYILSFMMSTTFNPSSSYDISTDNQQIFTLAERYRIKKTLNILTFYRVVELKAGESIKVQMQNLILDNGATFSLIKIREVDEDSRSFGASLSLVMGKHDYPVVVFQNENFRNNSIKNTTKLEIYQEHKQFINVKSYGLYVVAMDMLITAPKVDITVTLSVTNKADNGIIQIEDGISVTRKDLTSSKTLLCIRGIVGLPAQAFISLKLFTDETIERKMSILEESKLSLTQIPNAVLVGAVKTIVSKKDECKKGKTYLRNKPIGGYDLNKYILQNETKFDVPASGIYLIHLNRTVLLKEKNPINFTVFITHTRQGKILSSVEEIIHPNDNLFQGSFSRLAVLEQDDTIEVWTSCGKKLHVEFQSLYVLLASLTNLNFFIKNENYTSQNIVQSSLTRSYLIKYPGTYLVTLNILLQFENLPLVEYFSINVKRFSIRLNQNTSLVTEKRMLRSTVMGTDGLVSVPIMTFVKLESESQIIVALSYSPKDKFILRFMRYHFSYVLLSNNLHKIYGFRAVQASSKLFNFASHVTTPNNYLFESQYGGFELPGTNLFGPQVVVTKQMTLFFIVSVTLVNVKGKFWLSLQIPPERGDQAITPEVTILRKQTITLKASGIIRVEFGETVVFLVNGYSGGEDLVLCSESVWSLIEITQPSPNDHKVFADKSYSSVGEPSKLANHLFVQISYDNNKFKSHLRIDNKPRFDVNTIKNEAHPLQNHQTIIQINATNVTQSIGKYIEISNQTNCVVSFIQLKTGSLSIHLSGNKTSSSLKIDSENLFLLCLKPHLDKVWSPSVSSVVLKVLPLTTAISAFSASFRQEKNLTLRNGVTIRLDSWSTAVLPFFDRSDGYREGYGMLVASTNGFYFVAIKLLLKSPVPDSRCSLVVMLEDDILVKVDLRQRTEYNDVVWILKDSALQCMISCKTDETRLTFMPDSMFSSILIDSRPTLKETCIENKLILSINKRQIYTQVQTSFQITCHNSHRSVSDFLWMKNGKTLISNFGTREGSLKFDSLSVNDNGHYRCVMIRGKRIVQSEVINIVVIDPRPQLTLSNKTVFVDEGTISNPMVAWVQASAYNVTSNQRAVVKLVIAEGNQGNRFYFHPELTTTISSLYYRRPLDFEKQQTYTITFTAQNMEYDGSLGVVSEQIKIQVVNRNEHIPRFAPHSGVISIMENTPNGTFVDQLSAKDQDLTQNQLIFSFAHTSRNNLFRIDSSSGRIYVAGNIDYEEVKDIILIAIVDDGLHRAYKELKVQITNVNDNRPYFPIQNFNVTILEDSSPGFRVLDMNVADNDTKADNIRLKIKSGNYDNFFDIRGHSIVVKKAAPAGYSCRLIIIAVDRGNLESTKEASVIIKVLEDPRKRTSTTAPIPFKLFDKSFYKVKIMEGSKVGSVVYKIKGNKPENKSVEYYLREINNGGKTTFRINEHASIILLSALDTRVMKTYYVAVSACIQNKTKCELCHVTLTVEEDENSSLRFVSKILTLSLSENTKPKTFITRVKVRGRKTQREYYKIVNNTLPSSFRIGRLDGKLYLHKALNSTLYQEIILMVAVYQGSYSITDSCKIVIKVQSNRVVITKFEQQKEIEEDEDYLYWKYIIPVASFIVLLLLVLTIFVLCKQVKRSRKKVKEIRTELVNSDAKTGFLAYFTEPAESMEEVMSFSCESIPSAYHIEKDNNHVRFMDQSMETMIIHQNGNLKKKHSNGTAI